MISKTLLIRINPNTDGSYSVVMTDHNVPGAENRQQVSRPDFPAVQSAVANFLTQVAATDAAQEAAAAAKAEAERQAAEKREAAVKTAAAPSASETAAGGVERVG